MISPRLLRCSLAVFLAVFSFSCKPMCPISSCQVRMVHPHGERHFRGQPFYKKQNPKMGEKLPKVKGEKKNADSANNKAKNKK